MEELLDVLNEKGEYIGKFDTRANCHLHGLWHKAVVVFILDSEGQVLLQRRSLTKKLWPNMWDVTAGGHVLAGELGFQAVMRECQEELGISICKNELTFIGATSSSTKNEHILNNHINEYYVVIKNVDISTLIIQDAEVAEVKWISKNEIITKILNNCEGITDKVGCWNYLIRYYEWSEQNRVL